MPSQLPRVFFALSTVLMCFFVVVVVAQNTTTPTISPPQGTRTACSASQRCLEAAPFCNSGFCSASAIDGFIERKCDAAGSFKPEYCVPTGGCKSFRQEFTDAKSVPFGADYEGNPDNQRFFADNSNTVVVRDGKLVFRMAYDSAQKAGQLSRISSARKFHYGTYTARIRIPEGGSGLVYTWILKTEAQGDGVGDEIDYEILGSRAGNVSTNYFVGGVKDYTRGMTQRPEGPALTAGFHDYTIVYAPDQVQWLVDGAEVRSVRSGAGSFPSKEGYLSMSVWDTCLEQPNTVEWAGGVSTWCRGAGSDADRARVFEMEVEYVDAKCATEDGKPEQLAPNTPPTTSSGVSNTHGAVLFVFVFVMTLLTSLS